MVSISGNREITERDKHYHRQRAKNRMFETLAAFFAQEAELRGLSKRDIAESLQRDPAQITRWLSAPSNFTIETISDLLLSLGAEMDYYITRFEDRPAPNEMHPLMQEIIGKRQTNQTETVADFDSLPKSVSKTSSVSSNSLDTFVQL